MNYEVTYGENGQVIKEKVEDVKNVINSGISIEFLGAEGAVLIINNRDFISAKEIVLCGKDEGERIGTTPTTGNHKMCDCGQSDSCSVEAVEAGLNFGQAIEALKAGKKVAQKGWNGKGMFVYHVPAESYPPATEVMKSAFGGEEVPYREYLALKTAQNDVATWSPSTSDALAEDWEVVE